MKTVIEDVQYQLEEKMGDGKWQRVYETKAEADYESPVYKTFLSAEQARQYANIDTQRWSAGSLERGVVRVVMVTTQVKVMPEPQHEPKKGEKKTAKKDRHYQAKDALLALRYPDSLFDVRLFLTDDGRKRGLWIWLEEDWKIRVDNDHRIFDEGLKKFVQYLKEKKFDFDKMKPEQAFDFVFSLKMYFDYFFSHRTEAAAIRLSWLQVKKLSAALEASRKAEKKKTEDDDYDFDTDEAEEEEEDR